MLDPGSGSGIRDQGSGMDRLFGNRSGLPLNSARWEVHLCRTQAIYRIGCGMWMNCMLKCLRYAYCYGTTIHIITESVRVSDGGPLMGEEFIPTTVLT
jgi:hypothetical protein